MAILGTPIIDLWCERKLNENGTHTATLKWNPSYAKVNIYRKKDGGSWEKNPRIALNTDFYEDIIEIADKEYDFYYCASFNNGLIDITQYSCCCQSDIAPPGEVTDFSVVNGDKKVTITWTEPDDEDWHKTILVRKLIIDDTTVEPENENDGVQIETIYSNFKQPVTKEEKEEEIVEATKLLSSYTLNTKNTTNITDLDGNTTTIESEITSKNEYKDLPTTKEDDGSTPDTTKTIEYEFINQKNKYAEIGFVDKTLSLHKKYYYKCFTFDTMGNVCKSCPSKISYLLDKTPPRVAEFVNTNLNTEIIDISDYIYLEWQNPTNDDFKGTVLTRKRVDIGTGEPSNYLDGDLVYTNEKGINFSYYYDYDVEENVEYYYKLFPYDTSMNFNNNCAYTIKSMVNSYKITNFEVFPINETKYNLLMDEIYTSKTVNEYDPASGALIGTKEVYINIKSDLRGEIGIADIPTYPIRDENEINGFLSGVKLNFIDCEKEYDKLFIVRTESSYSSNFEQDTAKESPTNKIIYTNDTDYYYYGSYTSSANAKYYDYIVNKHYSKVEDLISVIDADEFVYNNTYYFGYTTRNLLTDKFENDKIYYYTAYILKYDKDSGGNDITRIYRQKLNAIKKTKFSDNLLTGNKKTMMNKFNEYFSLYDSKDWKIDHSISGSDLMMPYFYSNESNGSLTTKERIESNVADNLSNIQYISFNVEFGGWLNYGYFNKESYFSLDKSFIQLSDQVYNKIYDRTTGNDMFRKSSRQFLIQNEDIEDSYIPMIKIDRYNKLLVDSIVLAYNSQPSTIFSIQIKDEISNNVVYEDRTFVLPIVEGYKYDCIVNWGDGIKISIVGAMNEINIENLQHTYANTGTYFISIDGTCPTLKFGIGNPEDINSQDYILDADGDGVPDPDTYIPTEFEELIISTKTREKLLSISSLDGITVGVPCMFKDCINLHVSSNLKIPNVLLNCSDMFMNCESLSETPILSDSMVNGKNMFKNCYSLIKTCEVLPLSLKYSDCMFSGCNNLIAAPLIPKSGNITSCTYMFDTCINLRSTPNNWSNYDDIIYRDPDGNIIYNGDIPKTEPNPIVNHATGCYRKCTSIVYIDGLRGSFNDIPTKWK